MIWFVEFILEIVWHSLGFPGGSAGKESTCNVGDPGLIPGLGRSPGEGNGNPLQCSCLENPMDRGTWQVITQGVTKSWLRLSNLHTHTHTHTYKNDQKSVVYDSKVLKITMSFITE